MRGFRHREIEVRSDDADADRLAMGLAERGYAVERSGGHGAPSRSRSRARPGRGRGGRRGHGPRSAHGDHPARTVGQGARRSPRSWSAHRDALVASVDARIFAQRIDGTLAGSCELYVHGDVAQIERRQHARGVPWQGGGAQRGAARGATKRGAAGAPWCSCSPTPTTGRSISTGGWASSDRPVAAVHARSGGRAPGPSEIPGGVSGVRYHRPPMSLIESVHAREILDSRGNPTVEVDVMARRRRVRAGRRAERGLHGRARGARAARRRRAVRRQGRAARRSPT